MNPFHLRSLLATSLFIVATARTPTAAQEMAGWYRFQPRNTAEAGMIGMADWLEKPAGKHGRIERRNDELLYNGRPIKLWGLNLCFAACAPEKPLAQRRAAFYAKYGINAVRLHKFTDGTGWAGIQSAQSAAEYDPQGLDRMDYQIACLKQAGIFVKLSAHFGTIKLGPADRRDVPYMDEFGERDGRRDRISAPHSALFYSPELQQLHLRQMTNLLAHRNPYTGLTYAEDPAIFAIEIINEQSILFFTSMQPLKQSPTLRTNVATRFSQWLEQKYGDQAGLVAAWGQQALDSFAGEGMTNGREHLQHKNILPLGNPWYWEPEQLAGSQAFRKQRLLDTMAFLYELQCEAYQRYVDGVRAAGYSGELIGSNWQAGKGLSHYANLHSDYQVGLIDRHNYFGGSKDDLVDNRSMLSQPGSGLLSSGVQQVADRPFMLSEWIHVFPNEWGTEGPAIVGAYGMGLQGWDSSFMFQNRDQGTLSRVLGEQAWDVTAPQILGIFPAVSRQVLRHDVVQSPVVAQRKVHLPSLLRGQLVLNDRVLQSGDQKQFEGQQIPAAALAAVRTVVSFTEQPEETADFELTTYQRDGAIESSTKQLRWYAGKADSTAGYFTIDTPRTQAVVGFAKGVTQRLQDVTITSQSPFAAIYVTGQGEQDDLQTGNRLLVVALARARNTGMRFNQDGNRLMEKGGPPILLEPVKAIIQLNRPGAKVYRLDHDGLLTDTVLTIEQRRFTIDGQRDRTPYYLIDFPSDSSK